MANINICGSNFLSFFVMFSSLEHFRMAQLQLLLGLLLFVSKKSRDNCLPNKKIIWNAVPPTHYRAFLRSVGKITESRIGIFTILLFCHRGAIDVLGYFLKNVVFLPFHSLFHAEFFQKRQPYCISVHLVECCWLNGK